MYDSHESLKKMYEVSCNELDEIVNIAANSGAIGARMTGAGFGGCVIILGKNDSIKMMGEKIAKKFLEKFHFSPSIYAVDIVEGTHLL
ncbi:Galactokinase [bioreactor metagenome]|uniref:Galactokinase n=1 Tax=bioreactor metagenome TaxID=1076179 RepID=A0A645ISC5_9ZZZZ